MGEIDKKTYTTWVQIYPFLHSCLYHTSAGTAEPLLWHLHLPPFPPVVWGIFSNV